MSEWKSNTYLRRLHRLTLRTVLLCMAAAVGILALNTWGGDGQVPIAGVVAIAALMGYAFWLGQALWNPRRHAGYRALAAYGDPEKVARSVAAELDAGGDALLGLFLGSEWIVISTFTGLHAVRPADVMWIYPKVTERRAYGIITISRSHDAVILTRHRARPFRLRGSEANVQRLLAALRRVAPWAHAGYTDRESVLFERRNRATTFGYVDARRETMLAGG
jgi:hypothetical protein